MKDELLLSIRCSQEYSIPGNFKGISFELKGRPSVIKGITEILPKETEILGNDCFRISGNFSKRKTLQFLNFLRNSASPFLENLY